MASTIDLRGLVRPQLVEATKREDNLNVAAFCLQALESRFGQTLGNAMRRMLLSSLRGCCRVCAFRCSDEHYCRSSSEDRGEELPPRLRRVAIYLPCIYPPLAPGVS